MTNKEKALALIGTFVSGDLELAKSLLAPEYKQHNLAFGTGADAFVAAVAGLQQAPVKTTVNNIRAFEDGECVFLQTVYNFAGAGEHRWQDRRALGQSSERRRSQPLRSHPDRRYA